MNRKNLSERDVCTKFITPALVAAGWDLQSHIREEVSFTKGRVIVRGRMTARGEAKRADYILYHPGGDVALSGSPSENNCNAAQGVRRLSLMHAGGYLGCQPKPTVA